MDGANVPMACHGRSTKTLYIVSHADRTTRVQGAVGLFVVEWRRVLKVLKLSAQGLPQSWISLEQAVLHYAADQVRWEAGAEVAVFRGGTNAHRAGSR